MWVEEYKAYDSWDFADAIAATLRPVLRYDIQYKRWMVLEQGERYVQTAPEVKEQIAKIADLLLASPKILGGPGGFALEAFAREMKKKKARRTIAQMVQNSLRDYFPSKPVNLIPLVTLTPYRRGSREALRDAARN